MADQLFESKYKRSLQTHLLNPQSLNSYSYANDNPIVYADPEGEIIPLLVAAWAVTELALSAYDIYDTVTTVASDASLGEKGMSVGGIMIGVILPGGGYGAAGKQGVKYADDVVRGINKLNQDFKPGRVTKGVKDLDISSRAIKSAKDIAGFTKEGMNQIVTRGLNPDIIQDTLKNTVKYTQRIDSLGRTSFRYIGEKATLNFNKAGEFVTGWLKDSKKLLSK